MITVGYCRLSSTSLAPRYREIADAISLPYSKICWETDRGDETTNLNRLIQDAKAGSIETICVFGLDSFGGTFARITDVCRQIIKSGAVLVVAKHSLTIGPQNCETCLALIESIVDMERITRKQNQRSGIEAAKSKGIFKGRKKGAMKRKPGDAKTLKSKGLTHAEIASALGVSHRTVSRYLTA